jgi:hypothetical protein
MHATLSFTPSFSRLLPSSLKRGSVFTRTHLDINDDGITYSGVAPQTAIFDRTNTALNQIFWVFTSYPPSCAIIPALPVGRHYFGETAGCRCLHHPRLITLIPRLSADSCVTSAGRYGLRRQLRPTFPLYWQPVIPPPPPPADLGGCFGGTV